MLGLILLIVGFVAICYVLSAILKVHEKKQQKKERTEYEAAADPDHEFHEVWEIAQDAPEEQRIQVYRRFKRLYKQDVNE